MGILPVGILMCSLANMALSDSIPLARLMSETCVHSICSPEGHLLP